MKHLIIILSLFLSACASKGIVDPSDVVVTRDRPRSNKCKSIGKVVGRVSTIKETRKHAMLDLKNEAARKGSKYVQVDQVSDHGTSITGTAYICK